MASVKRAVRRVVAKVVFHFAKLFPRVEFIVTNLRRDSRAVARYYNQQETADQCIKSRRLGLNWTGVWDPK